VLRVEVGSLQQTSAKAVAGRARCATRSDFEGCVAEKSRLRRLRGLAKRGQEFIRVGNSLLRTLGRSTMGLKTRNRGPGRRLAGKDRFLVVGVEACVGSPCSCHLTPRVSTPAHGRCVRLGFPRRHPPSTSQATNVMPTWDQPRPRCEVLELLVGCRSLCRFSTCPSIANPVGGFTSQQE
jgi:hypothetical protein